MAALKIEKREDPQVGMISNRGIKFTEKQIQYAKRLTLFLQNTKKFNPLFDSFKGESRVLGGDHSNNSAFLQRLNENQNTLKRGTILQKHFKMSL